MDELALAVAALEYGHSTVLYNDAEALEARVRESGWSVRRALDGSSQLVLTDHGTPGADVVVAPVLVGEHRLCTLGLLLAEVGWSGERPACGAGPVSTARLADGLTAHGRDGTTSLVRSLRSLAHLELVLFDEQLRQVRVGRALSAQPPAFFEQVAAALQHEEPFTDG